ncbi:MAG: hypothetical protein ACTHM9_07795 [Gemmatimonadales bacterium]
MTYTFKLSRRIARLRAIGLAAATVAFAACSNTDTLDPSQDNPAAGGSTAAPAPELSNSSFAGGIPFGLFAQPTELFGSVYNGAKETVSPDLLNSTLAAIKARGGRVVLMMAGSEVNYKDASGHFSFSMWKQRIDRFRGVNFDSYITDGTIIGHYLLDEPQDPTNWNGVPVTAATVDQMGQYSKQLWPKMATLVRTEPKFFPSAPKYVDAAWAQYVARFGNASDYIQKVVNDAKARDMQLVVGLNLLDGGTPNLSQMTPTEVESYGRTLLSSTYPCAFISWKYNSYFLTSTMGTVMSKLRGLAQNRGTRSCLSGSTVAPPPPSDTTPPPPPPPPPDSTPTSQPGQTPSGTALAFGVFQAPTSTYSNRWTGSVYRADPSTVMSRLSDAQANGLRSVVNLARPGKVKNADGTFNLTKWKAEVDQYRPLALGQYVGSKTLFAHFLVDQPNCASCWGGKAIPWETVEAMAKYSKSIWPGLPTVAKVAPSLLAKASFTWSYLDAGWATYNTRQGDLRTYLANESKAASGERLGLMVGLNLLDAAGVNTAPMTANQIMQLGTIAAKSSGVCALVGWQYDASYVGQSGIRAALDSVAKVAKSRSVASCVVN